MPAAHGEINSNATFRIGISSAHYLYLFDIKISWRAQNVKN